MNNYCKEVLQQLEAEINEILLDLDNNNLELLEVILKMTVESLQKVKEFIKEKGFANQEAEINFFKRIKPDFLSKLIYYNNLYKIDLMYK